MTVDCLIEAIEAARETWDFVLGLVPSGAWETIDPSTGWSIKDQVAHVAWHELEMVGLLESKAFEGPPWWLVDPGQRDTDIHEEYKDAALADVLTMAEGAHTRLVEALEELDDEELDDPSFFKNMPPDWTPWHLIGSNTYQHYYEHALCIRRFVKSLSES